MDPLLQYSSLVALSPIIAFAIISIVPSSRPRLSEWIAVIGVGVSAALSLLILAVEFFSSGSGISPVPFQQQIPFLSFSAGAAVTLGIYVDWLTVVMIAVVSSVSLLIVVYSVGYMHAEGARRKRYFGVISMFVGVMLGLIMANNLFELYIFWELVGLGSYLLIGFWYEKPSAAKAAKKAFVVTRFGDMFLLFGIILLLNIGNHTLMYQTLFQPGSVTALKGSGLLTLATLAMFGGAMGKSAQFPLQDWLVDAMEGPTPVSAMIHGATMVNAGVYLVARLYPLYSQAPISALFVSFIGAFTALFAATMALGTFDIKRVLAFSTISQLGYMFMALGAGAYVLSRQSVGTVSYSLGYSAGIFHLMNQAIFKALLFLAAGSVMHSLGGTQDMREMGGLRSKLKITSVTMLFGSLSLAGIIPFSGFFSKDAALEAALGGTAYSSLFIVIWLFGIAGAFLTAVYIFRLWFMTFTGKPRYPPEIHVHESPRVMTVPLIILAVLTLVVGAAVLGVAGFAMAVHYPAVVPSAVSPYAQFNGVFGLLSDPATYLSLLLAFGGIGLSYAVWGREKSGQAAVSGPVTSRIYRVLAERYYFPQMYDALGIWIGYNIARVLDFFDSKVIDGIVNGTGRFFVFSSEKLRRSETGYVQQYAGVIVLGIVVLAILLILLPMMGA